MTELADKLLKSIDRAIHNVSQCDIDATPQKKAMMEATQSGMICGLMTAKEIITMVDQDLGIKKETIPSGVAQISAAQISAASRSAAQKSAAPKGGTAEQTSAAAKIATASTQTPEAANKADANLAPEAGHRKGKRTPVPRNVGRTIE